MERKIKIEKTIDLATAECQIFARYWEDSELNGVEDDETDPKMPCVESVEHFHYCKKQLAWCPIIDLDNGRILNWCRGEVTAELAFKEGANYVYELPLSDRLTSEEKEIFREMYGELRRKWWETKDKYMEADAFDKMEKMETIFGEDFFKEGE